MTGLRPGHDAASSTSSTTSAQGLPDVVTLPQMFMNDGYYAARVGKIYHYGNPGDIGTSGLDDPAVVEPRRQSRPAATRPSLETRHHELHAASAASAPPWRFCPIPRARTRSTPTARSPLEGIKLLEEHKDKPFFLAVGFYKPHTPVGSRRAEVFRACTRWSKIDAARGRADGLARTCPQPALASTQPVAVPRRDDGPGPRLQAGLLRRDLLRRRPDRQACSTRWTGSDCATTPSSFSGATTATTSASTASG